MADHKSRVGEKLVLWKENFSSSAYKDQMGIFHNGYIIEKEYQITIVEERIVKGVWGGGEYYGYRALTDDGLEFTLNWSNFPDDSMSPEHYWDATYTDSKEPWKPVDAIKASNSPFGVCVDEKGMRKIPTGASVCEKHNEIYSGDCWKCKYKVD
jgi:hypothetical protein